MFVFFATHLCFLSFRESDSGRIHKTVAPVIEVCGYLDIGDISSPPCISRHLVLPSIPHGKYSRYHLPSESDITKHVIYTYHIVACQRGMGL